MRSEAERAVLLVGDELIDVHLEYVEQVLGIGLGKPPTVVAAHHALLHDGREMGNQLRPAQMVLHVNPGALGYAEPSRGLGMQFHGRPGMDLAQRLDLTVLGVERGEAAGTRRERQRVGFREVRSR